jgi:hypothetical protein
VTGALLAIAILTAAGLPLAAWLEPTLGWRARIGFAFLAGSGSVTLVMLLATFAGIRWSLPVVLAGLALVAGAAFPCARRLATGDRTRLRAHPLAFAADAATLVSVAGYALFATVARPWEWDFWAIWGLKAKEFLLTRGVNFEFLGRPDNFFSHPDYPPLVPLVYDFAALVGGKWDDRWMGAITVAFAVAMLLVLREELQRQSGSALAGAFGTLAVSGVACSGWVGLGDGPLIALAAPGLLIMSRGFREASSRAIVAGSVLLGLSGLAKNEGVSFVVAAIVVTLIFERRRWLQVALPAAALVAPWLLARLAIAATTDVFEGGFAARVAERLSDPAGFVSTLAGGMFERPELWLILALLLALHPAAAKRERFLLGVAGLQALSYVAVYAGTSNDLASHVQSSLGRVTSHLAPLAAIVAVLTAGELLGHDSTVEAEGKDELEHET